MVQQVLIGVQTIAISLIHERLLANRSYRLAVGRIPTAALVQLFAVLQYLLQSCIFLLCTYQLDIDWEQFCTTVQL